MTRREFIRDFLISVIQNADDMELFEMAEEFPVTGAPKHGACAMCPHNDSSGDISCYYQGLCDEAISAWMDKEKEDWLSRAE